MSPRSPRMTAEQFATFREGLRRVRSGEESTILTVPSAIARSRLEPPPFSSSLRKARNSREFITIEPRVSTTPPV